MCVYGKAGCTRNERSTKIRREAQAKNLTIFQTYHVAKVKFLQAVCHVLRWKNLQRPDFPFGPLPKFRRALISNAPSFSYASCSIIQTTPFTSLRSFIFQHLFHESALHNPQNLSLAESPTVISKVPSRLRTVICKKQSRCYNMHFQYLVSHRLGSYR